MFVQFTMTRPVTGRAEPHHIERPIVVVMVSVDRRRPVTPFALLRLGQTPVAHRIIDCTMGIVFFRIFRPPLAYVPVIQMRAGAHLFLAVFQEAAMAVIFANLLNVALAIFANALLDALLANACASVPGILDIKTRSRMNVSALLTGARKWH